MRYTFLGSTCEKRARAVGQKEEGNVSKCAVHMAKFQRAAVGGIGNHNERKGKLTNELIDEERSEDNYELMPYGPSLIKAIDEKITTYRTSEKAVRKDAVVLCNFVISSDRDFFNRITPEEQEDYFKDSLDFFKNRYPDRVVSATVHLDETTPHMHLGVVPITADGRLSAKDLFNRNELRAIQTEYHLEVGQKYGLERGREGSKAKHLDEITYRLVKTQEAVLEAEKDLEAINSTLTPKKALISDLRTFEEDITKPVTKAFKKVIMDELDYDELVLTARKVKTEAHDVKQVNIDLKIENDSQQREISELNRLVNWDLYDSNIKLSKQVKEKSETIKQLQEENDHRREVMYDLFEENDQLKQDNNKLHQVIHQLQSGFNHAKNEFRKIAPDVVDYLEDVYEKHFSKNQQKQKEQDRGFEID